MLVIAFGGNAILKPGQSGTFAEQYANVEVACGAIAELAAAGHRVVVTHGNGPQVGNIVLQNEETSDFIPPMPLDACGAESQGLIGYMLQQALHNRLRALALPVQVVTVLTQVEVSPADPAFAHPTKPIGPFYTPARARRLARERGYPMAEDAGRGWRRVVPSPEPRAIVERPLVQALLASGCLVVAAGGGGIPVERRPDGTLHGVEAVIDKDLAAERLAEDLAADLLLILTDIDRVRINFRQPGEQALVRITAPEGRRYQAAGHFKAGSMGPKMEAALRFAESGRGRAIIGPLQMAGAALRGETGTEIVP